MSEITFTWQGYDEKLAAHRALQDFLLLDVQYSSQHADELRAAIEEYSLGSRKEYEGSGNGYEFECQPDGLLIECLYEGDANTPVVIDYPTILQVLADWSVMCGELECGSNRG